MNWHMVESALPFFQLRTTGNETTWVLELATFVIMYSILIIFMPIDSDCVESCNNTNTRGNYYMQLIVIWFEFKKYEQCSFLVIIYYFSRFALALHNLHKQPARLCTENFFIDYSYSFSILIFWLCREWINWTQFMFTLPVLRLCQFVWCI